MQESAEPRNLGLAMEIVHFLIKKLFIQFSTSNSPRKVISSSLFNAYSRRFICVYLCVFVSYCIVVVLL